MVQLFKCHSDRHLKFLTQGIIGTGTCVLSKVPIVDAVFHEFSMNGYPHQVQPKRYLGNTDVDDWCELSSKILHGDWFAGKGLGVVTLDFKGLNVHVRELNGRNWLPIISEEFLHQFCPKPFWPRCLSLISTQSTLGRRTSISATEFFRWLDNLNTSFVMTD